MNHWISKTLLGAIVGLSLMTINTSAVQADDDYWDNYWSWYDGSYRPYYSRRHTYRDRDYRPHYSDRYYDDGYYGRGYGYHDRYYDYYPRYRDYGTSRFGYREYSDGGGSVRVGPLRFGWR